MNKYPTKFLVTISKDNIHSRTISDEYVCDGDTDIEKKNFAQFFINRKFIDEISSNFTRTQ